LTGAILHDIGKVEELSYSRSFSYTAPGQLLGHIVIGLRIVGEKIDKLPGFPSKLRVLIEHMIISHHGVLEFGSPKVPLFLEALLLHHLDNLDSKMESMRVAVGRDQGDGDFTGWIGHLERVVLKKAHFLGDGVGPVKDGSTAHSIPVTTPEPRKSTPPTAQTLLGEKLQAVLGDWK
jgi:3'-5' exoribonuclease